MPSPSLPITPKLAGAILKALHAVICGHQPTLAERRRAGDAVLELTNAMGDQEERDAQALADFLRALTPELEGEPERPVLPRDQSPFTRGGRSSGELHADHQRRAAAARLKHTKQPRPPSGQHHRALAKNLCPCCRRRIPRYRRGGEAPSPLGTPALRAGCPSCPPAHATVSTSTTPAPTPPLGAPCVSSPRRAAARSTSSTPTPRSTPVQTKPKKTAPSPAPTPHAKPQHPTPANPKPTYNATPKSKPKPTRKPLNLPKSIYRIFSSIVTSLTIAPRPQSKPTSPPSPDHHPP